MKSSWSGCDLAIGFHGLSGLELRHHFFISTAPGFDRLSRAKTKGGMSSMLQ